MASADLRPNVYFAMIFFWVMTYVIVGLRVYVRTCMIKSFGRDDVAMLIALGLFTGYLSCQAAAVTHGVGRHREDIPHDKLATGFRAWLFAELFYTSSTSALKVAIGLFLDRVTENRNHKWLIRIMMAATVLVGTVYFFVALFQCHPISFFWDFASNPKGSCISPNVMVDISYIASALNGLADWIFGILPIFIVKDLNMKKNTKIVVAAILGFAAIGSLSTLIRLPYVKQLGVYKGDFLYTSTYIAIWSTVEVGVGISAASLATLRPLMQQVFPNLLENSAVAVESHSKWTAKVTKKPARKDGYVKSYADRENARTVTTTVVGANANQWAPKPDNSSEENIVAGGEDSDVEMADVKTWDHGISKSVKVTTIEERNSSSQSSHLEEDRNSGTNGLIEYERV